MWFLMWFLAFMILTLKQDVTQIAPFLKIVQFLIKNWGAFFLVIWVLDFMSTFRETTKTVIIPDVKKSIKKIKMKKEVEHGPITTTA